MKSTDWDYRSTVLPPRDCMKDLTAIGDAGWECFAVVPIPPVGLDEQKATFFFKRPRDHSTQNDFAVKIGSDGEVTRTKRV